MGKEETDTLKNYFFVLCYLYYAVLEVISDPTQLVDNSTALVVSRTVMMSIYPFLFLAETSAATELLYLMALKKVG